MVVMIPDDKWKNAIWRKAKGEIAIEGYSQYVKTLLGADSVVSELLDHGQKLVVTVKKRGKTYKATRTSEKAYNPTGIKMELMRLVDDFKEQMSG